MQRRSFIKAMAGALATAGPLSGMAASQAAFARKGGAIKKMVVLFQLGGSDGLNTLIPVESTQHALYQGLRPDIHVPSGSTLGLNGESFFGLHPAMSPLVPVFNAGNLAMIHAVGYPNPDRSHFESQAYFETAVPGNSLLSGWLNRYLANTAGPGLVRGISIGGNIPQAVTGVVPVPVSTNFGRLNVNVDRYMPSENQEPYRQVIRDLYALSATNGNAGVYDTGNTIFQMVDAFSTRDSTDYTPENGAVYPDTRLGDRVAHAAQMLKDDNQFLGVELVVIEQGGYDTHSGQIDTGAPLDPASSQQPRLLNELSTAMAAFNQDMGAARMQDTLFLVITEFGRRAYQNDSFGTDHGTGSVAMLMGGNVNGGCYNGGANWPGLAESDLYRNGDDLMWATDFRDIYWEIMSGHFGLDNNTLDLVIPGHTYSSQNLLA